MSVFPHMLESSVCLHGSIFMYYRVSNRIILINYKSEISNSLFTAHYKLTNCKMLVEMSNLTGHEIKPKTNK